jgi:competence protein ComEC
VFDKQIIFRLSLLAVFIGVSLFTTLLPQLQNGQLASVFESDKGKYLTVAFLDVGQGDSIFIETPDGKQMLIDGGPDNSVLRELSKLMSFFDRNIDVVLATHSDKDHIGGLVDVLKRYEVETLIQTENENDTAVAEAFTERGSIEKAEIVMARAGQQFELGASTTVSILSPANNPESWESNSASIIVQVQYGEIGFMLTGDAGVNIEEYLAYSYGDLLESEVLKLGHHGSRTSTSELFLDKVQPQFAVVSAGADNRYGHPHKEVVDEVVSRNIKILSTAAVGNVVFQTDGERLWVE